MATKETRRQIPLSDDTWNAIRHLAIDEEKQVGELIEFALIWFMDTRKQQARQKGRK